MYRGEAIVAFLDVVGGCQTLCEKCFHSLDIITAYVLVDEGTMCGYGPRLQ